MLIFQCGYLTGTIPDSLWHRIVRPQIVESYFEINKQNDIFKRVKKFR